MPPGLPAGTPTLPGSRLEDKEFTDRTLGVGLPARGNESVNPGGVVAVTCPNPEPVVSAVTVELPPLMVTGETIVAPGMSVDIVIDTSGSPPANC